MMASERSGRRHAARLNGASAATSASAGSPGAASLPAFEEALGQIEEIVQALESGRLQLEEALSAFEQGMRLAQVCQDVLNHADLRVRQLVAVEEEAGISSIETIDLDVE
jgi:exodeoxyribonuclease VII small subunit